MKKLKIWSMMMLMVMALPLMVACGGDDSDDVKTINKSELIGTWYTVSDGWILEFTSTHVTQYEFYGAPGSYKLNTSYVLTQSYTVNGNQLVSDKGEIATVSINGNTMNVSGNGQNLTYTKYNGTPQQLIDYLNGK